ncbi:MAG: hypothetical protein IJN12_02200 [Clostridia bacterium]|nr:hypothetical protein [Clostridia bacterium]
MNIKRILAAVLSVCMLLSVMVIPTFAATSATPNLAFTVDAASVKCGEAVTVEISLNSARCTNGVVNGTLEFDSAVLEIASVTLNPDFVDSNDADVGLAYVEADGKLEISFTAPRQPAYVPNELIATVSFEAIAGGDVTLTLNEESTIAVHGYVGVAQEEALTVGHDFDEILLADDANLVSAADCVNAAVYYKACTVCSALSTETFEFGTELGHDWATTYSYDDDNHWFDCSRCAEDKDTAAHNHDTMLKNADGHWTKCVCGHETELVAHTESPWIYDVRPTMDKAGHRYKECTVCGQVLAAEDIVAEDLGEEVITYVIVASASEGGTISPADKTYVLEGESVVYNFYPEVGYEVAYVMVNGAYLGKLDSYTFANVAHSGSIYVVYKELVVYDDGYVETPEIVIPEDPAASDEALIAVAEAKLAELKAVSTAGCSAKSAAAYDVAVLALELAVENGASGDEIVSLIANAYLAKENLEVGNAETCDD